MIKKDLVLALTPHFWPWQKRSQLVKKLNDSDHQSSTSPLMEGTPTIKSKKKLLQIIDTTLLKCYLHVSSPALGSPQSPNLGSLPLVRVKPLMTGTSYSWPDVCELLGIEGIRRDVDPEPYSGLVFSAKMGVSATR